MRSQFSLAPRLLLLAALFASGPLSRAMSVIAPTFPQLVASSDLVARGVVTDVHAITVDTPQGQAIKTLVTLRVERALKGSPGEELTLTLLGGTIGHRTLSVVGMPKFKVGDREIVFVSGNGHVICPLVAAGHGRYHVRHDDATNRDIVYRDNGSPLSSTDQIAQPMDSGSVAAAATSSGMALDAFEAKVTATVNGNQEANQQ